MAETEVNSGDRVAESVRKALRLVGPAEGGHELWVHESPPEDGPAQTAGVSGQTLALPGA